MNFSNMNSQILLAANLKVETDDLEEQNENLQDLYYDGIPVKLVGYNAMNDMKSLYSTLGISCTRRCVCSVMNNKHMKINQKFVSARQQQCLEYFVKQMCPSTLHFGLNLAKHFIEKVGGHKTFRTDMCVGKEHKKQKQDNILAIQDAYRAKGIRVSFKVFGGGTSNDGESKF